MRPWTQAWLGACAAVVCLAAWAAGLFLPWMSTGALEVSRGELADGIGYEQALVAWPAVALPVAAAALGTACWATLSKASVGPRVRQAALLAALAAATVAGVAGARFVGLQVARVLDPGDPIITLLVPPYATLAAATLAAGAGVAMVLSARPGFRPWPGKAPIACAATLLALPLVPFGVSEAGFALHIDELLLALAASTGTGDLAQAGRALAWARALLWSAAALAAAATLAAAWAPRQAGLRRWGTLAAVPLLAGAVALAATFQWRLWQVEGLRPGWNFIALAGAIAALALQANDCAVAWRPPAEPAPAQGSAEPGQPTEPAPRKA